MSSESHKRASTVCTLPSTCCSGLSLIPPSLPPSLPPHLTSPPSSSSRSQMSVTLAAGVVDSSPVTLLTSSPSTPLSSSLAAAASCVASCWSEWRLVGLESVRPQLDHSALQLADEEDRASAARSSLSVQSKALKRAAADEKLSMLGAVVRAYQSEINALTRRSKAAEAAYLSLYRLVSAVQDPTHALQQAMAALQQAGSVEAELVACRQQVDELDRELSTLKNQDATLRRVEQQLREVDKRTEQKVREAVAEHEEASRQSVVQERREAAERESALRQSLDECRQSLAHQAAAHQQQQDAHFKESEKYEKAARETERELDGLRADNERLQHSLQAINCQRAVGDSQQLAPPPSTSSMSSSAASELEAELQSLRDALSAVQLDSAESHEALRREREERKADRRAAVDSMERLTLQIAHWKHKALISSSIGPQQHDSGARPVGGSTESSEEKQSTSQAALMTELAATRSLNEQLAQQRDEQQSRADSRIQQLSVALKEAERATEQYVQLIAQLEADISVLQHQQQRSRTEQQTTAVTNPASLHPLTPLSTTLTSTATARVTGVPPFHPSGEGFVPESAVPTSPSPPSSCCSSSSLLHIVSGQRDRLRVRVEQLERELSDRQAALTEARSAKQQLQDDNVTLYEKLQYVKSFEQYNRASARSLPPHLSSHQPPHSTAADTVSVSVGGIAASERRYAKLYAESLNPFSAWKSGQLLASERSLPPSERLTLTCARLLFSRRAARSFAFFYALVLHLLVFAVLWTHTVSDHCALSEAQR